MLLQDTSKFSLMIREYFVTIALQFFVTWIPLRIISRTYRVSTHPQLIHECHQSSKYHSIFRKSSVAYCSWSSLPACIMVTSICLAIFIKILCDRHSDHAGSTCVWMHTIISYSLKIILPARTSFWTWAGCRPIKLPPFVPLSLFNLLVFWSEHLLLILRFGNHNFFLFKH